MTREIKRITRERRLTPEEAGKYQTVREQVAEELPELVARHHQRQLSHAEAAARDNYCPNCRMISYDPDPDLGNCAECGDEGFDCCRPICPRCIRDGIRTKTGAV